MSEGKKNFELSQIKEVPQKKTQIFSKERKIENEAKNFFSERFSSNETFQRIFRKNVLSEFFF